jgi:hypothetical protein
VLPARAGAGQGHDYQRAARDMLHDIGAHLATTTPWHRLAHGWRMEPGATHRAHTENNWFPHGLWTAAKPAVLLGSCGAILEGFSV